MFQKIIYVDPKYEFVVYKFIPGETMKHVDDVNDTIQKIVSITNSYTNCNLDGFGYLNEETSSWSRFLKDEITHSSLNLKGHIPSKRAVNKCVEILENYLVRTVKTAVRRANYPSKKLPKICPGAMRSANKK